MTGNEKAALEARIDELCAENERLRQENQSISMAAYEVGYKNGSVHYELEHCPACKNVADLQEALDENTKLRELVKVVWGCVHSGVDCYECRVVAGGCTLQSAMRELGIEVAE